MVKNNIQVNAGNKGEKVRSDCSISLELTHENGLLIELQSKVKSLYGNSIKKQCIDALNFYEIKNAILKIEDTGALPHVIMARLECAIKQLIDSEKELLPELIEENKTISKIDQFRFSRLYLPGNSPSMMINAGIHNPNAIILDLEDAVAPEKKMEASYLVRNSLRAVNFYGAERMVRINQLPKGLDDLRFIVPHHVNLILLPKCENAEQIKTVEKEIEKLKHSLSLEYPIYLMPIIESALGVENAFEIASASANIVAMAIGLEDYTADIGVSRTKEGNESFYARTRVINACKAAKIQPIDSVYSDVADMEGLAQNVKNSKSLGFEGMGCIHPSQIIVIHKHFAPEITEIEKAKKTVIAFDDARQKGLSVVSLGTKMIDAPVVKRAETTIRLAIKLGLINEDWKS